MKIILTIILALFATPIFSQPLTPGAWPPSLPESRPYTRWWWLGSAVDEAGLRYNLSEYARVGIGGVEITPIYGVKGNDANNLSYLSPEWMQALRTVERLSDSLKLEVNMATGTGWPFGGPQVPLEEAAGKLKVVDGKLTNDHTRQQVKRAAPGGEGFVIDHFDRKSVANYLATFDRAFAQSNTPYPHTFFNDSYEVYNADWTPTLLSEFKARRGYALEDYTQVFLQTPNESTDANAADLHRRVMSDYRETLSDLLLYNFTTQWTDWAHQHGSITRNQAHGSPANLIDLYAQVDIPECEGFGLTDFHIRGLRTDPGFTKANYSDLSMLKYASSGAHISGKKFTSSETFTWLTEHFRTSFSQCKPDFDLMMVAGVNHIFFHGSCYTPQNDPWPGWKFYASIDMSPTNNLWRDAPAFFNYIQRTQAFMQHGEPDNDILVYLPFHDMLYEQPGRLVQFDIHSMAKRAPRFINAINAIIHAGFDCDYISDRYLLRTQNANRQLTTTGRNRYAAILVPGVRFMPLGTIRHLLRLARQGAPVIFIEHMPEGAPGLKGMEQQTQFNAALDSLRSLSVLTSDYSVVSKYAKPELMRTHQGLSCIRRAVASDHFYFISNLQERNVDEWVTLGVNGRHATLYNPMDGTSARAAIRQIEGSLTQVRLQLLSGQSTILYLSDTDNSSLTAYPYLDYTHSTTQLITDWTLSFVESAPISIKKTYKMAQPTSWTSLGDNLLNQTMAVGRYSASFKLTKADMTTNRRLILDLGDVRETAQVSINGRRVATVVTVPYQLDITDHVRSGNNQLDIEVANLGANRISQLDREGVQWRKFNEINVVDLNYKNSRYDKWEPMPSGLCSAVRLLSMPIITAP